MKKTFDFDELILDLIEISPEEIDKTILESRNEKKVNTGECSILINHKGRKKLNYIILNNEIQDRNSILAQYLFKRILKRIPKNATDMGVFVQFEKDPNAVFNQKNAYKITRFTVTEHCKEVSHSAIVDDMIAQRYDFDIMEGVAKDWEEFHEDDFRSYKSELNACYLYEDTQMDKYIGQWV